MRIRPAGAWGCSPPASSIIAAMRRVVYVQMFAVGPGLAAPRAGSLADLVTSIPYLVNEYLPPIGPLNDMLRTGRRDAGMSGGCIWEPLEIDPREYEELAAELTRRGRLVGGPGGVTVREPIEPASGVPDWVCTYADWSAYLHGKPLREETADVGRAHGPIPPIDRDAWVRSLPVPDLYDAWHRPDRDPDVEPPEGLPAPLVTKLGDLRSEYRRWDEMRARWDGVKFTGIERERGWIARVESLRHEIEALVERDRLQKWPFKLVEAAQSEEL